MVRAILDGRKTQTRRIKFDCEVDDVLWVRETWKMGFTIEGDKKDGFNCEIEFKDGISDMVHFKKERAKKFEKFLLKPNKWISSMYMPREACRLFLKVEDVWEQKLQDISPGCICCEGVEDIFEEIYKKERRFLANEVHKRLLIDEFIKLWDSINARRGYGWDTNPMVKVIEFKLVKV
ncbi:MAG: hypothetical protein LBC75_01015 [Fibromonadaceae bacterium]|jgi:hypothetical protein|nr:hypothetical protein [Fibromonadaceae bacterium]